MSGGKGRVELVENGDVGAEEAARLVQRTDEGSTTEAEEQKPSSTQACRTYVFYAAAAVACAAAVALLLVAGATIYYFVTRAVATSPVVHFFVIGDWGRDGRQNQSAVADAMAVRAEHLRPEFIVSVGDNMYESPNIVVGGLVSAEDKQFETSFTGVYHHSSLQIPWHVILGNHDYGEFWDDTYDLKHCPAGSQNCSFSPLHQLNETLMERDRRWHCERSFQIRLFEEEGLAELFFIDTNPFIRDYHDRAWAANEGGIHEQSWQSQLLELDADLARSEASWKLVFGHHPVRNNHGPSNTVELVEHLEPVLEERGVQAYFSGHEHNLQHLHVEGAATHYIVSGAGSKTDYFPETHWDNGGSLYQHQGSDGNADE